MLNLKLVSRVAWEANALTLATVLMEKVAQQSVEQGLAEGYDLRTMDNAALDAYIDTEPGTFEAVYHLALLKQLRLAA